MRRITASVLSIFMVFPALADSRLPVVNVSAGSVSARAAFGDAPRAISNSDENIAARAAAPAVVVEPVKKTSKKVAARTAKVAPKPAVDTGDKIASADILMPRRPSSDLWAKTDAPLRMPTASEISVVRADYDLPEESLDTAPRLASVTPPKVIKERPVDDMDLQIERLIELQRRADESARVAAAREVAPRPTVITAPVVASREVAPVKTTVAEDVAPVKLSRMVVPMDNDDVVVRAVEKTVSPRIAAVRDDMTRMSPAELRKAFRKTYLSENKHLSTYQMDNRFDVASDMSADIEGFNASRDLSESGGVRPLEIKIRFRGDDSALSRDNYNLLTEYAGIVVSNPKRAIQISIPQRATTNMDDRKLAARRLAIVEQVLRDTGVSEQRIMPVLSQRNEDGFVLRVISSDQYETLSEQKRNVFGDTVSKKTYKSMSW